MTNPAGNLTIWPSCIGDKFIQPINLYPDMQMDRNLFTGQSILPLEQLSSDTRGRKPHGDNVGPENRAIHQKQKFFSQEIKGFREKTEKSDQNSEARTKLLRLRGLSQPFNMLKKIWQHTPRSNNNRKSQTCGLT